MKDKYLVGKVDGLGRVVIPKEIRNRINISENDYLEFFYNSEYMLIKKYSRLNEISNLLSEITDILSEYSNSEVLIIEKDNIVAYSGIDKDLYINKKPSKSMIKSISRRESLFEEYVKNLEIIDGKNVNCSYINEAIVFNDEVLGLICLYNKEKKVSKEEYKLVKLVVKYISKYLDEM